MFRKINRWMHKPVTALGVHTFTVAAVILGYSLAVLTLVVLTWAGVRI